MAKCELEHCRNRPVLHSLDGTPGPADGLLQSMDKFRRCLFLLFAALAFALPPLTAAADESPFVRPDELEHDIAFWRRIYTEVTTEGGLLHDPERPDVVYEVVKFPATFRRGSARSASMSRRRSTGAFSIGSPAGEPTLTEEEQRVQDLWPKGTRRARFEQAAEDVRFQLGQSDRFREGIVRSGAYRDHIAATFDEDGLAAGARGAPARRVLVQYVCLFEGRRGRHVAVHAQHRPALPAHRRGRRRAARSVSLHRGRSEVPRTELHRARQLAARADRVQPWHRRHAPRAGTDRHERHRQVVRKYNSRSFGFASRNFYVAFLAALEIDSDPEKFFGPIRPPSDRQQPRPRGARFRAGEPHRDRAGARPTMSCAG